MVARIIVHIVDRNHGILWYYIAKPLDLWYIRWKTYPQVIHSIYCIIGN